MIDQLQNHATTSRDSTFHPAGSLGRAHMFILPDRSCSLIGKSCIFMFSTNSMKTHGNYAFGEILSLIRPVYIFARIRQLLALK